MSELSECIESKKTSFPMPPDGFLSTVKSCRSCSSFKEAGAINHAICFYHGFTLLEPDGFVCENYNKDTN